MQDFFSFIGLLAGGLGLFLLAVNMITDGLKSAAGSALRDILSKSTRSPLHGIATGVFITAIVQSSSAVTVATIGFVNAGLISMRKALGIVYGSNIGTTMTGWIVALLGFKINVESFALPIIGIGMLLHLTGDDSRRKTLGLALTGFGLFFVGIDVLRQAFEGLVATVDLNKFTLDGILGVLVYVGIGFLMTVFTQSSSAAIALTLTAATGGVLGLYAAAAMVIGANLGTTSTAALAVIHATSNAKRVAWAHIIFNAGTGLVALATLPVLFWIVEGASHFLRLEAIPAVTLAMFHSVFNVLGVILIFPLNDRLASFLENRFVTQEEIESRPRHLDKTVAVTPILAINALVLELSRIMAIVRRIGLEALSTNGAPTDRILSDELIIHKLSRATSDFIGQIGRETISQEVSEQLTRLLSAQQHLLAAADQAVFIARSEENLKEIDDPHVIEEITGFRAQVTKLLNMARPDTDGYSFAKCEYQLDQIQSAYEEARATLLFAGAEFRMPISDMTDVIEQNSRIRRFARQLFKTMYLFSLLSESTEIEEAKSIDDRQQEEVEE